MNKYDQNRNLPPTVFVGFENIKTSSLKIIGYYKQGFLRKEKSLVMDCFEKVTLCGLNQIKNNKLSLECLAELKGEKYFLYLSADK